MFNDYAAGVSLLYITTIEIVVLAYGFGVERLEKLMTIQTGETFPTYSKIMVKYVSPVIMIGMTCSSIYNEFFDNKYDYPKTFSWIGRFLFFVQIICVPIGFLIKINTPNMDDIIMEDYGGKFVNGQFVDMDDSEPALGYDDTEASQDE